MLWLRYALTAEVVVQDGSYLARGCDCGLYLIYNVLAREEQGIRPRDCAQLLF